MHGIADTGFIMVTEVIQIKSVADKAIGVAGKRKKKSRDDGMERTAMGAFENEDIERKGMMRAINKKTRIRRVDRKAAEGA